jgi:MATE family multidrug resistance protein
LNPLNTLLKREDFKSYISRSWSISWPMTLIMFFEFLIGITDVYIAGKGGKEIQATYGFVIQLYFIFIVIANALTVGSVSLVSRLYTSGNKRELTQAIFSSVVTATVAGIILALVSFVSSPVIIHILNLPEELKHFGEPFIKIYAVGLPFHYELINCNGILRSCNRIKTSLKTMAFVCLLNITLNFLLVFHTPLSFRGIALATTASVFIGGIVNLIHVNRVMARGMEMEFSVNLARKMILIGWPVGLLQILWQLASMVLFLILSALSESRVEILAALTMGLRIESAIYLPAFAFNMANAVVVGNLLGAQKKEEAFWSGMVTAAIGVGVVTLMVILVIANARWIVSSLSQHPIVMRESVKYIYISMISEPFMAWGIILGGGLNGAGDTKSVMLRVSLSLWLVRIPLSYVFVILLGWGAASVWWCMNLSQFVQAFLISKRYLSKRWL